jgi:drug/metabolite transporter (DMT)-like permease
MLDSLTPAATGLFVLGGVVGTGIGRLLNYSGVKALGASVNSAGVATDPVFAAGIAVIALGEGVTVVQVLGVCLVVTGLAITVLSGGGNNRGWPKRALIIPLGAALAYGSGAVIRRYGLLNTSIPPIQAAAINETAALVALGGYALFQLDRDTLTDATFNSYTYLIAAGIINTVGLVSFFIAIDNGPVVIGSTLAGMSTLVTVGSSAIFLGGVETVTRVTAVGAVLTVLGASLVV